MTPAKVSAVDPRSEKKAEQERLDVVEESTHAKGPQFFARSEHDLLAPLRIIRNLPDWIADDLSALDTEVPGSVPEFLETIKAQARRMENLVRDLNRFERLAFHSIEPTELCISTRIDELVHIILPEGPWGVEILGDVPSIMTDVALFDAIIVEIISNALKHHTDLQGFVRITLSEVAENVEIEIIDNGPGVPTDQMERIFEPFSMLQSRDEVEGSGLGLSIALRAVKRLGGHVSIAARDGLSVSVVLPMDLRLCQSPGLGGSG